MKIFTNTWPQVSGFPGGSDGEESAHNPGDLGSIPGSGRSSGEGNGYPLQDSCLENSMERGDWWGLKESDTSEGLTGMVPSHAGNKLTSQFSSLIMQWLSLLPELPPCNHVKFRHIPLH